MNKIVFDIETKNTFSDVGGKNNIGDLEVSVVGVYSYNNDEYVCFNENEMDELGSILQKADPLIGFSSKTFDVPVLEKYFNYKLSSVPHYDILEEIENNVGHKIGLAKLGEANIGMTKTASSGLKAIKMYKEGDMEGLQKYCLQDVRLTKEIFDKIERRGFLWIPQKNVPQMKKAEVSFEKEEDPQDQLI